MWAGERARSPDTDDHQNFRTPYAARAFYLRRNRRPGLITIPICPAAGCASYRQRPDDGLDFAKL
jgi:hypothetical protein